MTSRERERERICGIPADVHLKIQLREFLIMAVIMLEQVGTATRLLAERKSREVWGPPGLLSSGYRGTRREAQVYPYV
jgi:hypothetical protein